LLCAAAATAQAETTQHPPASVTLDISDFVTVLKWAFEIGLALLVTIAGLGVTFFGFDVRRARSSIETDTFELKKTIEEAKKIKLLIDEDYKKVREIMDEFEQTASLLAELTGEVPDPPKAPEGGRTPQELIKEIISNSRFEWTTIGRIMKTTGLDRSRIMDLVHSMKDIRIGTSKKSHDVIFRLKRDGER
jgi:hypothetical protein